MNKNKENSNTKIIDYKTQKSVEKLRKIISNELDKSDINDMPLIIIRYIVKAIFNKISIDEVNNIIEIIGNKEEKNYDNKFNYKEIQKTIKNIIKKFKKDFKTNKYNYLDFIQLIGKKIDNSPLLEEENTRIDNWFLINGLNNIYGNFIKSLQDGINNIENIKNINILITINSKIKIFRVAPFKNTKDNISEFSSTEILKHVNSKLDEIKNDYLKENKSIITEIKILSDKEVIEFKQNEVNKEISELLLISQIEENFYNNPDFLNIEDNEKEVIANIINTILIYLKTNHENPKDLIYKIFDGFKIENNSIKFIFIADRTEKRHIRKITESEKYKNFIKEIYQNTDYKIFIKFD